jgi:hypothetical protein
MIRRDVIRNDRDQGVVKWSLVAAAFALSIGCLAEVTLERHSEDAPTAASQAVQVETVQQASITG